MDNITSILDKYKNRKLEHKPPPHEKAASVNEIISLLGQNKQYSYTYWLSKIGTAQYSRVLEIVKAAKSMPVEMRGGYITNQLKPYAIKKPRKAKNHATTDKK